MPDAGQGTGPRHERCCQNAGEEMVCVLELKRLFRKPNRHDGELHDPRLLPLLH